MASQRHFERLNMMDREIRRSIKKLFLETKQQKCIPWTMLDNSPDSLDGKRAKKLLETDFLLKSDELDARVIRLLHIIMESLGLNEQAVLDYHESRLYKAKQRANKKKKAEVPPQPVININTSNISGGVFGSVSGGYHNYQSGDTDD